MGYFSRLDHAAQSGESSTAVSPRESDVPTWQATQAAADPAASAAADPAAGRERPEEVSSTAVALEGKPDDTAARQAHEAAEARRKAEWEARQQAKRTAAQAELDHLAAMSDEDIVAASIGRIAADTEKLTRRNMKEAVCEHIQAMCRQAPAFARRAMAPEKSMVNCFRYINRRAQEYAEQEMKDNGIKRSGVYGLDVPDGLCYQWAVDYFNDPDAREDHESEEKFVPKPYMPKSSGSKPAAKPKAKKEASKKAAAKPQSQPSVDGQLSFMGVAG